ncbi:2-phosphosulfolactate phosphatase [Microvirga lenta]|uniref:2-phosphosulfolactate phosphatase n=1 Tax=Microvirga lenta TaxID=2881337 RepID=UPI001CFF57B8|nr:2-phosphosulfolactate phosphatase [Microvirga lenta]MCB5176607.1 2-phosphosulfolactate phosphatase [Microvirga lenta]
MTYVFCEWGLSGIEALLGRVAAVVIVDVLSFSTAVDVAVSKGATVYPFPYGEREAAQREAERLGAVLARPRRAAGGQFSLSPASLATVPDGMRLMLPSPNGSRLSLSCGGTPVLAGCLRNAAAVARAARIVAGEGAIGVVPAGELWPDGSLRPAVEDLLGAGAILHHLDGSLSAEAEIARAAYRAVGADLPRLIRASMSGRELIDGGFGSDVEMALESGISACAPVLRDGAYRACR